MAVESDRVVGPLARRDGIVARDRESCVERAEGRVRR
jgi:hypothetical protein